MQLRLLESRPVIMIGTAGAIALAIWLWRASNAPQESRQPIAEADEAHPATAGAEEAARAMSQCAEALAKILEGSRSGSATIGETAGARTPGKSGGIDDGWLRLPRHRREFLAIVKRNPEFLAPDDLFRNVHLNPRDVHIPASERQLFSDMLQTARPVRMAFFDAKNRVYGQALMQHADKARTTKIEAPIVSLTRKDRAQPTEMRIVMTDAAKAAGLDFATVKEGMVVGLSKRELPGCNAIVDLERFADIDFGSMLAQWFKWHGTLEDAEANLLLESLHKG